MYFNLGGTPLHFACAAIVDSASCVDMLVKRGAKINVQDHKKNTPLMVAAFFNKPKILQYLIDREADLSIRNNEEKDAYDVADEKEHVECKTIIVKQMEKLHQQQSHQKKSSSTTSQIDCELAKNFELRNRIR